MPSERFCKQTLWFANYARIMINMTPEGNEFLVLINVKTYNKTLKAGETDYLKPFKHQNVEKNSKSYGCGKKVRAFSFC